jgi:hypothetical protein
VGDALLGFRARTFADAADLVQHRGVQQNHAPVKSIRAAIAGLRTGTDSG